MSRLHVTVNYVDAVPDEIKAKFQFWAEEINKDWTGYAAKINEAGMLAVSDALGVVARVDYSCGRYTVLGGDPDVIEQLNYMIER